MLDVSVAKKDAIHVEDNDGEAHSAALSAAVPRIQPHAKQ